VASKDATMTKTETYTAAALAVPAALALGLARLSARWIAAERATRERTRLRELPEHLLRDIGLERGRF
jgi:uncharacterized protein YjiS (DUF1127 family)